MSVWTEVQGTIFMKRNSKFSVKTYIVENFQEANPKITQTQEGKVMLSFHFSESNVEAANQLQILVDKIKEHDLDADVDLTAIIRFVS